MYDAAYPGYADGRLGKCFRRSWASASRMSSFLKVPKALEQPLGGTTQPLPQPLPTHYPFKGAMMTAELLAPYIANTAPTMQPFLLQTDNTITQIADHVWCKLRFSSSNGVATPAVASRHDCVHYLASRTTLGTRHRWKSTFQERTCFGLFSCLKMQRVELSDIIRLPWTSNDD